MFRRGKIGIPQQPSVPPMPNPKGEMDVQDFTKADLRKALETAIGMIEGTSFEKYSEDLDNFVNSVL